MDFGKHLVILLVDNHHRQFLIFDEIASFVVEHFQSDAPVATFLRLFLDCHLAFDTFRNLMRNGVGWAVLSIL